MTNKSDILSVQKVAAFFGLFLLAAVVVSFVVYRTDHPSLTRHVQTEEKAMGDMTGLMERLKDNPEDKEALFMLGQRFMRMQAWDKALEFWERLIKLDPENKTVLTQKGFCLFQQEEYEQAVEEFKKVLDVDDTDYRAHYNLGMLYKYYLEEPQSAREHLQKALENLPPDKEDIRSDLQKELSGG
ncbi:MAG: tetratricopeptide repeat protein [Desulfonatronovibrionaceae bacterium]